MTDEIVLDMEDLRQVAAYAAENAADVLSIFEGSYPTDSRPRDAVDAAWAFARGDKRGKALRDAAWSALRAAQESQNEAASHAARAAMCASSAAYLHPLPRSTQIRHILGAPAHAARAVELAAGDDPRFGVDYVERACRRANARVVEILCRFPSAPRNGGRVGHLLRSLDQTLRAAVLLG